MAAMLGVLTSVLTLYAKYLDIKKQKTDADKAFDSLPKTTTTTTTEPTPHLDPPTIEWNPNATQIRPEPAHPAAPAPLHVSLTPQPSPADVEKARQMVKAPAIALISTGILGLIMSLFVGAYGFIDTFVTPLSPESRQRQMFEHAEQARFPSDPEAMYYRAPGDRDNLNAGFALLGAMGFGMASGLATWAGAGMLRLRGYWFSVAGSIAIMPASFVCCMGGVPVGVWSLVILMKPEVSTAFK